MRRNTHLGVGADWSVRPKSGAPRRRTVDDNVRSAGDEGGGMGVQHIETLIIGAGQAGLSTGYHLQRLGRPCLIVDANERVGDNWRQQWDSLRLYTPAKYNGLPGLRFPGEPWTYPGKEQV